MLTPLKRALLFALGGSMFQVAQAQVKPATPAFVPACELQELNWEYVAALTSLRRQLNPLASPVKFDPALFVGTVLHSAKMEAADSMFHAPASDASYSAELVGAKRSVQTHNAKELAKFMLTQFQNSERHCALQSNSQYLYVAISATANFYVVRLSATPGIADKASRAALTKLGVKLAQAQEVKPPARLVYRAF